MGKAMLAMLCFIPLVICVGAHSPPITSTSGLYEEIRGLKRWIDIFKSAKDELVLNTTRVAQLYSAERSQLTIMMCDRFIETIEWILGFLREIVLQDSVSPSREGSVRYAVESPMEKLPAELAASSISDKAKPREDRNQRRTGLIHAMQGFHFPEYSDIPDTSFDCSSQAYIPGIYADTETGCQVFHVCWPHKKESFLCPIGTTFNQAILACDFWYNSDCALSPSYYDANTPTDWIELSKLESVVDILNKENSESVVETDAFRQLRDLDLTYVSKMFPVKAKVTVFRKPRSTDSKEVEMSIDGEKTEEDIDVTEELAEMLEETSEPEIMSTEFPLSLQPMESRGEGMEFGTTKLPPTLRSREPRGDGMESGTTKLPLTSRSREPRAESDGDELEDTTELPLLVVPRRPRAESEEVELGTTKLPLTFRSREPRAGMKLRDSMQLPLHAIRRKPRARQEMRSTFAAIHDVLGLVQQMLRRTEIYYMVSDEKPQPPHARIPTSATPGATHKPKVLGTM